jgi:hypothetical protein
MGRHRFGSVLVAAGLGWGVLAGGTGTAGAAPVNDALWRRTSTQLASFTSWLAAGGKTGYGYIGEVGWPASDARWGELATAWYHQADRAWLWTSAWSAGEWWPSTYPLAVYAADGSRLTGPNPQALIVEAQAFRKRSVNLAGAEFGTPEPLQTMSTTFSNRRLGVVGTHYRWPNPASMPFLAARGITTVRLPFRWERMQPNVNGPLDSAEVARLLATIDAAAAAGVDVILDLHNYGAYWASDAYGTGWRKPLSAAGWLRPEHLADLWRRLSEVLAGRPGVIGYDLMNEPVGMPGGATTWGDGRGLQLVGTSLVRYTASLWALDRRPAEPDVLRGAPLLRLRRFGDVHRLVRRHRGVRGPAGLLTHLHRVGASSDAYGRSARQR